MKKLLIALFVLLPVTLWAQTTAEPYAVLSDDGLTVTFYYDDQKASRGGMEINNKIIASYNGEKNPYGTAMTAIIDDSFANYTTLRSTAYWFMFCGKLTEIRALSNLNTANVTDMSWMFAGCSGLTSLDVSGFNTANVTDLSFMFYGCSSLTSLDVSGFNTANVTDMADMFDGCSGLTSLDVRSFNTANVTNMCAMFYGCSGLTSLDVRSFNTANVTDMRYMFSGCSNLTSLDLSGFNTANVTDMRSMFFGCSSLTSLDLSSFNTANVTRMESMFSGCSGLTSLDVSGFNTANVTDMSRMFDGCSGLTSLDLSGFNTANVTDMSFMFDGCSGLTSLDLSGFNTANVTDMSGMFQDCSSLTNLDVSSFNTANVTDMTRMFSICSDLTGLNLRSFNTEKVIRFCDEYGGVFSGCSSLVSLDLSSFNTANVTDMRSMFSGCSSLTSLDLSSFNTANVTDMRSMFFGCSSLTSLDVSGFNTANVTDMRSMFSRCSGLTSLDVSGFNTANVTYMSGMFFGCSGLTSLDVSGFNTANVTNMGNMFSGCSGLTSLDVSGFNTENVTGMSSMFQGCSGLTSLDVSGFNTANVTDMSWMFYGCSGLTKIFAGDDWNTALVTDGGSMFTGCTSLVGGAGTAYDANHTDHTYAHIDGGTANPGYFTYKNAPVIVETEPYAVLGENNTVLTFYYDDQKAARNGMSVGPFDGNPDYQAWYDQRESITSVVFDASFANCTTITSTAYWFMECRNLAEIRGLSNLNTANVTDMGYMFQGCFGLTSLDVSGFNTANVTGMGYMFSGCYSLTSLDLSGFNTANVTDMGYMFQACSGLTSLDVSGFNTANVTDMSGMFSGCRSLTNLDLSVFNTANVTDMGFMFDGCSGLTSLDVSGFNTANVTNMGYMFYGCSGLTSLDVSGFNTANVKNMGYMFYGCSGLTKIFAGDDWNTALVTDGGSMFTGCTSLVGGAGTAYDANHTDHTYAHIDGGTANPGYFTSKNAPQVDATFVGTVLTIGGQTTMAEALQTVGRDVVVQNVSTIVWNSTATLTESDLEAITNPNLLIYATDSTLVPKINNVVVNGVADNVVLTTTATGNCNFYAPEAFTARRISYTRDFQQQTQVGVSRGWESIALPFDVQSVKHEKQGDIAPFGSTESGKHFWLRSLSPDGLQRATRIEANVPYVLSMPNNEEYSAEYNLGGRVTFSAQNATVPVTAAKVTALADSSITMVPTTVAVGRSSSVWALNVGQVRGSYLEGSVFERDYREVRPFEAYTVHRQGSSDDDNPSPRMIPVQKLMVSDATGIEEVRVERSEVSGDRWYDLNGRRLQARPTAKGVYIKDGRKVVIK